MLIKRKVRNRGLAVDFLLFAVACFVLFMACRIESHAAMSDTQKRRTVTAVGRYLNWDGVSSVVQFKAPDDTLYYAIDFESYVTVYRTNGGMPSAEGAINLVKQHPIFGGVTCDMAGNFFLITGETNSTDDTSLDTVFVSKYDRYGNFQKTTGDNGRSSLAYYYDDSFHTSVPFDGGNCDVAINGRVLTVMYGRHMYNGHQSCSVFSVNTDDLSKVNLGPFYASHSFAQRVVSTNDGFVYVSEGDAYDRAFTEYSIRLTENGYSDKGETNIFDFWVEDGALDAYNMYVVNENFAHMGGLASLSNDRVAFVSQSVRSLNESAKTEKEDIFIQIFDPFANLSSPEAYSTEGVRSGLAGPNGRTNVTNYGVKWLTSLGDNESVSDVQIVATGKGEIIVLYEYYVNDVYKGVYYIVLDEDGNEKRRSLYSSDAMLNPCVMPVYSERRVMWLGNRYSECGDYYFPNDDVAVYIFSLDIETDRASVAIAPTAISDTIYDGYKHNLIEVGAAEGGWLTYAVTKKNTAPDESLYSEAIPAAEDAGNYYVWYKIKGDDNHTGTDAICLETKIDKADSSMGYKPRGYSRDLTYGEWEQYLLYSGGGYAYGGEIVYAVTTSRIEPKDSAYKTEYPRAKKPGTYYVWYKVRGDANHNDTAAEYIKTVILKPAGTDKNDGNGSGSTSGQDGTKKTIRDKKSGGIYVVTSGTNKSHTVKYTGSIAKNPTAVTIPATIKSGKVTYKVTEVGAKALKGKKTLKKVTVGKNVIKIGAEAFSDCTALTSLDMPSGTTKLGKRFVYKCKKLKNIRIKSKKITEKTLSDGAFEGLTNAKSVKITVPSAVKKSYTKLLRKKGLGKKITIKADSAVK